MSQPSSVFWKLTINFSAPALEIQDELAHGLTTCICFPLLILEKLAVVLVDYLNGSINAGEHVCKLLLILCLLYSLANMRESCILITI